MLSLLPNCHHTHTNKHEELYCFQIPQSCCRKGDFLLSHVSLMTSWHPRAQQGAERGQVTSCSYVCLCRYFQRFSDAGDLKNESENHFFFTRPSPFLTDYEIATALKWTQQFSFSIFFCQPKIISFLLRKVLYSKYKSWPGIFCFFVGERCK